MRLFLKAVSTEHTHALLEHGAGRAQATQAQPGTSLVACLALAAVCSLCIGRPASLLWSASSGLGAFAHASSCAFAARPCHWHDWKTPFFMHCRSPGSAGNELDPPPPPCTARHMCAATSKAAAQNCGSNSNPPERGGRDADATCRGRQTMNLPMLPLSVS
jgi:hypothetical protein